MSQGAPVVLRPGWLRETGGRYGALLVAALVLIGGAVAIVKPGQPADPNATGAGVETSDTPPSCFTDHNFPLPPAINVESGGFYRASYPGGEHCGVHGFESTIPLRKLEAKMRKLLRANGWKVVAGDQMQNRGMTILTLQAPLCGQLILLDQRGNPESQNPTRGSIQMGPCTAPYDGGQQPPPSS